LISNNGKATATGLSAMTDNEVNKKISVKKGTSVASILNIHFYNLDYLVTTL